MKKYIRIILKSGTPIEIPADYDEFITRYADEITNGSRAILKTELAAFSFGDIELIQPAVRQDVTITRSELEQNITSMRSQLQKFERYIQNMTTDSVDVEELSDYMEKPDFTSLGDDPVETGAPIQTETPVVETAPEDTETGDVSTPAEELPSVVSEVSQATPDEAAQVDAEMQLAQTAPVVTDDQANTIAAFMAAHPVEQPAE